MLEKLNIDSNARIKTLSKGTKEKVQLILVMSRRAKLYCLDEPIAGVDVLKNDVEDIRFNQGKSVDVLFREVFKC